MTKNKRSTRGRERTSKAPFTARILFSHESHPLLRKDRLTSAFNVNASTDLDLLSQVLFSTVDALGFGQDGRLLVGSIASAINRMTPDLRKQIVGHVLAGSNLYVNEARQYNCKECGREDVGDDDVHLKRPEETGIHSVVDEVGAKNLCEGFPKEESAWVVTTGRYYEPLLEQKGDEDDAPNVLWKPGDD